MKISLFYYPVIQPGRQDVDDDIKYCEYQEASDGAEGEQLQVEQSQQVQYPEYERKSKATCTPAVNSGRKKMMRIWELMDFFTSR